ncbi:MAG: cold-shock protein [Saprospirales bacterium]|nr:MAG: cold-shock protein [Saprospirales bacterium]
MKKGVVKFFNDSKGFGFIRAEGEENDIFVHASGLIDDIRDNDVVVFDVQEGRRGPNAVNVKIAD